MAEKRKIAERRKMPVKRGEITLDGDYEGWTFGYRKNLPMGKWAKAIGKMSGDDGETTVTSVIGGVIDALEMAVLDWNFVDEDGNGMPLNRESLESLPDELLKLCFKSMKEQVEEAPLVSSSN